MQLQRVFFGVFQIIIASFYLKMLQIMFFDPFLTILNEKSNMQHLWPVFDAVFNEILSMLHFWVMFYNWIQEFSL